jgi:hypothetical protein
MHQAQGHQPVDRLHRIDGVAARDRDAGLAAHRGAAFQDLADGGGDSTLIGMPTSASAMMGVPPMA